MTFVRILFILEGHCLTVILDYKNTHPTHTIGDHPRVAVTNDADSQVAVTLLNTHCKRHIEDTQIVFRLCDENPRETWAAIGGRDPVASVLNGDNQLVQSNGGQEQAFYKHQAFS